MAWQGRGKNENRRTRPSRRPPRFRHHRVGGQRRYSPDALDRVLLMRFAGEMSSSLPEIKLLLSLE